MTEVERPKLLSSSSPAPSAERRVGRLLRQVEELDDEQMLLLAEGIVELLSEDDRLELFDSIGDTYCTNCGEELPEHDEPDHECPPLLEEGEEPTADPLADEGDDGEEPHDGEEGDDE